MRNNSYFDIDRHTPIWIYGCGIVGVNLCKKLMKNGVKVCGFLDQKALMSPIKTIPCYNSCDLSEVSVEDVIVLTFQNFHEHEKTARRLLDLGYSKIIYLGLSFENISEAYDLFNEYLYGKLICDFTFPYTKNTVRLRSPAIIRSRDSYQIVNAPAHMLFNNSLLTHFNCTEIDNTCQGVSIFGQKGFMALVALSFGKPYSKYQLDLYIDKLYNIGGNTRTKLEFLKDRVELFHFLQKQMHEHGMKYFEAAPVSVAYQKGSNTFKVIDGNHRATFLAYLDSKVIPVRLSKIDYSSWENIDAAQQVEHFLNQRQISKVYTPILSPRFYEFPTEIADGAFCIATQLLTFFYEAELSVGSVLDVQSCNGYYSRILYRAGISEVVATDSNFINRTLIYLLNKLEFCDNINVEEALPTKKYDLVLLVNQNIIKRNIDEEYLTSISNCCSKYFIIRIAVEYRNIYSNICRLLQFESHVILGSYFIEDGIYDIVVLKRPSSKF